MVMAIESHPKDSRYQIITPETNQCIPSIMCHDAAHGGLIMQEPVLLESNQNHATIQTNGISTALPASMGMGGGYVPMIKEKKMESVVRRLTPMECERLQGYPDGWTDIGEWTDTKGKKHKEADSPRYKALGNSIALPFWQWMAERMCAQYDHPIEIASLFDGIGVFRWYSVDAELRLFGQVK